MIKVRIVRSSRDGAILKWKDEFGAPRQRKCPGRTQRSQEAARKKLETELNTRTADLLWSEFWDRFDDEYLSGLSSGHRAKCRTMKNRLAEAAKRLGVQRLRCRDINATMILEVKSGLRTAGNQEATIKSNMDTLWSMLTWGQDYDLIPPIARPRRRRGKREKQAKNRKSKGRSLTLEEIDRMVEAIPSVKGDAEEAAGFIAAMTAMRLIGLRLTEAWLFSWEPIDGTHHPIRLDTASPAIEFSDIQKSGLDEIVPLAPEAAEWLRSLDREGLWICRTRGRRGEHKTPNRLGRVIAAAGRRAGVVVKRMGNGKVKCASAHDLRRTFATNMYARLKNVSEVQVMTRHADFNVLLENYVDADTPTLVEKLNGG